MRLFVAIELGSAIEAAGGALIEELRGRAKRIAPNARITWAVANRLHLTVRFIGEADSDRAAAIQHVLEAPLAVPPFELTVTATGAFPQSGRPRVLWAGLSEGRARLLEVEREVTSRLATAGVPPDDRAYSPHLTLARVRDAAGLQAKRLFEGLEGVQVGTTRVETITLFESRLSPKGSTYLSLVRTPLRPA